ncbi:mucin-3B-like [Hyla sarda]|uniref:mucin-3B-like n=1 Tax=Hyla sarda TaxID=327740 RepID=UPI0024C2B81B|nr:mucin-3B-like [Hyla sarda]
MTTSETIKMTSSVTNKTQTVISTSTKTSISTSASFVTTPKTTVSARCQNGGTYDGIKCICPEMYQGSICETIVDRAPPVKTVDTSVKVELKINNKQLDENLMNNQSDEYKEFEKEFKVLMKDTYADLDGYKDVEIVELKSGSIIVDHLVIVEVEYKEDMTIEKEYENILQQVTVTVNTVKESFQNCTEDGSGFCFDPDYGDVTEIEIPNTDYCDKTIDPDFRDFFTQIVTAEGLTCLSHCDTLSMKYVNCSGGRCVIQKKEGPQCFCPRTDLYMYTGSRCTGKILKAGLYGGIGAAIGVLVIIVATVGFLLFKSKKTTNWDTDNDNNKWYEDSEEEWDVNHGITNLGSQGEYIEDGSSGSSQSNKEKFRPRLENVDTTVKVKIQRPEVTFV